VPGCIRRGRRLQPAALRAQCLRFQLLVLVTHKPAVVL